MEEETSDSEETINDGRNLLYQKGYPFYRLNRREMTPSMNLCKTFDIKRPQLMDFSKDITKNKWSDICTNSFLLILADVELFARDNNFTNCQAAGLMEIFYSCFQYFLMLPALDKDEFLEYFRNTLVLYSVRDPADSMRIFNAKEGIAIAKLFHELVANNFEMMKYVLIPVYRIEIDAVQN